MRRVARLGAIAFVMIGSCAAGGSSRVTEYLDPQTAVTIRTLTAPLVYAHDAPALAVNSRDYLSLGLVEVNNMGARKHFLALVSWSTIDRKRAGAAPAPVPDKVEINFGGKSRELTPASHEARSLGIGGALFRPPSGYAGEGWYAMTVADLRALAANPPESIALLEDEERVTYVPWSGAAAAIEEFVRDIPDPVSPEPRRR